MNGGEKGHRAPRERRLLLAVLAGALFLPGWGDPGVEKGRQGVERYKEGDLEQALTHLEEARESGVEAPELDYDLGVVHYRRGEWEEAQGAFGESLQGGDDGLRARGYYNLGNTLFQAQDYRGAAGAYRRALELDPDDEDAKYNLELALKRAEQMPPPQQQPQPGDGAENEDRQENEQGEQTPSPQEKSGGQQDEDQQQDSGEEQEKSDGSEQEQQPQPSGGPEGEQPPPENSQVNQAMPDRQQPMGEEDAERLLDALRNEEAQLLEEKEKRRSSATAGVLRDW